MGLLSVDLLIALQILPGFFSNCLFLALYDSVVLLKHMVLLLSRSKAARGEWRRMLTSEGLRCVWNSFLLDAYKQVEKAPSFREGAVRSSRCFPLHCNSVSRFKKRAHFLL
uniref:Iodothyronine deiodinase n=1 Tax=Gopherus evgoodei TaxID=1825980 RepID=A0A8C4W388_9SAUR